jgi:hypothetical protein
MWEDPASPDLFIVKQAEPRRFRTESRRKERRTLADSNSARSRSMAIRWVRRVRRQPARSGRGGRHCRWLDLRNALVVSSVGAKM